MLQQQQQQQPTPGRSAPPAPELAPAAPADCIWSPCHLFEARPALRGPGDGGGTPLDPAQVCFLRGSPRDGTPGCPAH